jgi:hypothetical protein
MNYDDSTENDKKGGEGTGAEESWEATAKL